MASPVKRPVASEMPRCAPPHTFGAGEEPEEGERDAISLPIKRLLWVRDDIGRIKHFANENGTGVPG